jgi:hypothetical protein
LARFGAQEPALVERLECECLTQSRHSLTAGACQNVVIAYSKSNLCSRM